MRVLFAGTPSLAVPALEAAARAADICAVLTASDKPAGRGRDIAASPVKEAAQRIGLRVLQPEKLDAQAIEEILSLHPDLLAVAAYGKIFRQAFLDIFPLGGINLHPSLLPRYRGPSPITAVILGGDAETGVTIQRIALKFDTGDILAQTRVPLGGDETTTTLTDRLAAIGADLLASVLADMAAGKPMAAVAQNESDASYCATVSKEDGRVDWSQPAESIERKVRAYDPWPRAGTTYCGQPLLLLKTAAYPDTLVANARPTGQPAAPAAAPGVVLAADKARGLLVQTGHGVLAVERLQPQFKKPMDWKAFLNGHPDCIGARLGV